MRRRRAVSFAMIAAHAVTWVLLIVITAPVLVVLAGAFFNTSFLGLASEQWATGNDRTFLTSSWFGYVFHIYGGSLAFSLGLAFLCVGACILISVPAAYAIVRTHSLRSRMLEELALLPLSVPGIAMSIGLIQAYSIVRGQWWLILCGHLLYTMPLMMRVLTSALRSSETARLEVAAESLGASWRQRFLFVVIPNLRHSIIVGSLLVFAISWGEFNVSFLLNTPLHQTFPAALYATYTANSFAVSSAATTIFLAVVVPALLALQWIGGGEFTRLEQPA